MVIIKLGTTCAIYPRLENRVEVELWYFKFQVLANTVRKCQHFPMEKKRSLICFPMMYTIVKFSGFDAVLERITVGFFDKFL